MSNTSTITTRFGLGLIVLFSLSAAIQEAIAQQEFEIDNSHTSMIFSISHFKIGYLYGRFNKCSGQINLDRFNPSESEFKFQVVAASVDTNNSERDTALRSPQFFDSANFPTIEFVSSSVTEDEGTFNAKGNLKIRDVSKEVTIPFKLLGAGDGPMGKPRIGMISRFTIKRSEFGMKEMLDNIGDDVAITFSFQAVRN